MNNIAKSALIIMISTIVSKILGFGREVVLASAYGTSVYSDAYLTAMNIPGVIFSVIGAALSTTFIPIYFDVNREKGKKYALDYSNNVFNIVIVFSILLCICGVIFSEQLVSIFAVGFKGNVFDITVNFTRIIMIGTFFISISNFMTSYLQIHENFLIPAISSIPFNIIIIISIIISSIYSPNILVYGTMLAMITQYLFQFVFAKKIGFKYYKCIDLKDKYIKKMIFLLGPVILGVAVNQINALVDRTLASTLVEGSISALNYANRLNNFVLTIFISSVAVVIYPMLSKLSDEENREKFTDTVVKSINITTLLIIPITVGAIILSKPIVEVLFQRGAFDSRATEMTASALIFYSLGLIGYGLREILGKVFYSLKDTKTPMINGIITMVLNIVLNIILIKYMAHSGLALATSISALVSIILLFYSLNKKVGYFGQNNILKTFVKSLIAALLMGFVTYNVNIMLTKILSSSKMYDLLNLALSVIVGVIVYIIGLVVLRVKELEYIKKELNKILKK